MYVYTFSYAYQDTLQNWVFLSFAALLALCAGAQDQPKQSLPTPPNAIQVSEPATDDTIKTIQGYPDCISNGQAGYRGGQCKVQIWRSVPISPPTLTVPAGTVVHVELFETRQNEITTFTLSSAITTPHQLDPKSCRVLFPGLIRLLRLLRSQLIRDSRRFSATAPATVAGVTEAKNLSASIKARQDELVSSTNDVLKKVQNASESMTCLSSYETLDAAHDPDTCSQASMLKYDDFPAARDEAFVKVASSTAMPLRLNDISDLYLVW